MPLPYRQKRVLPWESLDGLSAEHKAASAKAVMRHSYRKTKKNTKNNLDQEGHRISFEQAYFVALFLWPDIEAGKIGLNFMAEKAESIR